MHSTIQQIIESLEDLSQLIIGVNSIDTTLTENYGWNTPALNRHDLANMALVIADKLRASNIDVVDDALNTKLEDIPDRLIIYKRDSLPQIMNSSNAVNGVQVYIAMIEWVSLMIEPLFSWELLGDNKAMPSQLARRLRGLQIELNNLVPDKELIEEQIKLIKDATETAESLPTDLESLKEARAQVNQFSSNSAELYGKIDTYFKEIETTAKKIEVKYTEAEAIVKQCDEAYRVTTSKGLAGAFDQRATRLSSSMWVWVGGLLVALALGAWIGAHRVELLSELIKSPKPQWGGIWIHLVLSLLSISAPIWFAWLATKQINQRFRLSEDYAFKASVAKAYEGYRREAARIDEAFEARLFSSTLSRLEEAPLRLVESDPHGSPWHEFISSPSFKSAIDTIPELKETFIKIVTKGASQPAVKQQPETKEDLTEG